ncbi:RNI-like superfamily protein [Artemisia annua]|uniref:RNI-like superfamily protein n=1 Tax=Artemisia annua TaxID=35608 RepID=A0A2U1PG11_ARTAN|nr:RNI-like superfamily protein [Artemisia annua]
MLNTDNALTSIADACVRLAELSIRSWFNVTDEAMKTLAIRGGHQGESTLLHRLKKPYFHGYKLELEKLM